MVLNEKAIAILDILRCPRSGRALRQHHDEIISDDGRHRYPIIDGKPVLVRAIREIHLTPPKGNVISKNSASYKPSSSVGCRDWVMHLGCGEVPSDDPQVISVDILPTTAADIVAEGEALPFADNCLGAVESGAVFEHVYDPFAVIAECKRVIREGGYFLTDTAFMQPYHGFPAHYFNMTPVAAERYFADDFELVSSWVGPGANPGTATLLTLERLMLALGREKANELKDISVMQFIELLRENRRHPSLNPLFSPYHMRSMATGTVVLSRKPSGYAAWRRQLGVQDAHELTAAKNDYYELRQQILWIDARINEIADEISSLGREPPSIPPHPDVNEQLATANIFDRLDRIAWRGAVDRLLQFKVDATGTLTLWQRALTRARAS